MKQFFLTSAMGKRLIGKAMARHPEIVRVLEKGTLVIIAGTTNGYVAEEILRGLGQAEGFSREGFRRGMTVAPGASVVQAELKGDVVIVDGRWQPGKTIFDVTDELQPGDVILKGANAFDARGKPAVLIGHVKGGTITAALNAVVGRRVQLWVPVGLEKRVLEDVDCLAELCNARDAEGARLLPIPGRIFTELEAVALLTGAHASLVAAGGVYGAEGGLWLGISGEPDAVEQASALLHSLRDEPACKV